MADLYRIGRALKENGATATPRLPNWQSQQKIDAGFNYTPPKAPPPPSDSKRR